MKLKLLLNFYFFMIFMRFMVKKSAFQGTRFEIKIGIGIEIDKLRFDCKAMAHVPFCKNAAAGLEAFYDCIKVRPYRKFLESNIDTPHLELFPKPSIFPTLRCRLLEVNKKS
ncbi:MAG: hypothetical protein SWH68_03315 [Thermodesulfobacteriota bacterium]|nr:hypothetical protein [Thermodesulfobacteriota bacterium]